MNFQDKEGVGSAGLKLVVLESMVEASLHNIPSRGHKYRAVVSLKRKGKNIRCLVNISVTVLNHCESYFEKGNIFYFFIFFASISICLECG